MTSRSLTLRMRPAESRGGGRIAVHAPSARVVFISLVAVLILFRWLHLVLALGTTATGRQIQLLGHDLDRWERLNAALQWDTAVALSPGMLAERAARLGYEPRTPLYLILDRPISASPPPSFEGQPLAGTQANRTSATGEALERQLVFGMWLDAEPKP